MVGRTSYFLAGSRQEHPNVRDLGPLIFSPMMLSHHQCATTCRDGPNIPRQWFFSSRGENSSRQTCAGHRLPELPFLPEKTTGACGAALGAAQPSTQPQLGLGLGWESPRMPSLRCLGLFPFRAHWRCRPRKSAALFPLPDPAVLRCAAPYATPQKAVRTARLSSGHGTCANPNFVGPILS